jgi:outer membrane lipopolysaccharide assembly protein LptE/RlpB
MRRLALVLLLLPLLCACGYRFTGRDAGALAGVATLRIELFGNRTAEPYLENRVTDAVTLRFARTPGLQLLEGSGAAGALLGGTVLAYSTDPIAYDRDDRVTEYRSVMTVEAVLTDADGGRVLWKDRVEWSEEYPVSIDKSAQEDAEAAAIAVIADRIAQQLHARILDGF